MKLKGNKTKYNKTKLILRNQNRNKTKAYFRIRIDNNLG